MKLKVRPSDFKVTERLAEGAIQEGGGHRVYRVIKEKLTSIEAASELAAHCGVTPADVAMAGLKDRQGVTTQFMSVPRGPSVSANVGDRGISLNIQSIGFSAEPISASMSEGNDFQVVVRDLGDGALEHLRSSLDSVRSFGLPNYFDSQRFGNLRHGQGWIVLDLLKGDVSGALRKLVASPSPFEPPAKRRLKEALIRSWDDWSACRSIAGKLGRHHSVFEHLKRDPDDFEGAFERVGTRERLIHLYAFQSHLWNRALGLWVQDHFPDRVSLRGIEGMLRFPGGEFELPPEWEGGFMLPGAQLDGVTDPVQRELYERTLERMGLEPQQLELPNVAGFQLKPELRPATVRPHALRVRPAEEDNLHRGRRMVKVQFGLPRGAYATMVIQRLVGQPIVGGEPRQHRGDRDERTGGDRDPGRGGHSGGYARGARGGRRRGRGRGGPRRGSHDGRRPGGGFGSGDAFGAGFGESGEGAAPGHGLNRRGGRRRGSRGGARRGPRGGARRGSRSRGRRR
ncbi:MAG: tRNA pseudouridine(13) synthase TruD [Planctomycetota bacterium]